MGARRGGMTRKQRQAANGGPQSVPRAPAGEPHESRFRPRKMDYREWKAKNADAVNWKSSRAARA